VLASGPLQLILPLPWLKPLVTPLLLGAEQMRVCVKRYDKSAKNRRQTVFTSGALHCTGRLDIEN